MDNIIFAQYTKNKHIIMGLPYDVLVAKTRDLLCQSAKWGYVVRFALNN